MAIKVFGILCLIACSVASHYAYDYSPVYHQQPIAYVQPPTVYHAGPVATQVAPTVYHAAPVATQVAPTVYHAAPVATQVAPVATLSAGPVVREVVEYASAPAKYDFSYGVHDSLTGDIKSQRESRDGGVVQGSYSLIDADGYRRTVTYTADDVNGFNAVVHREPLTGIVAPIVAAQVPQQQYLPVAPSAPGPFPVPIASAPVSVPVPVQQPAPVEQQIDEGEYAPAQQQPEQIPQQEDNNFQISPQSDDDSEVIDAFGAASRSVSTPSESNLNQEEVAPQQQQQK